MIGLGAAFLGAAASAADAKPSPASAPWDLSALSAAPKTYPAEGFQEDGVTAIFYDGLPFQGKPTRVFAWYGIPKLKSGERCPAMVLVHGGGGTAFAEWVRLWVKRGYAAVAMDTCGCIPKGEYAKWQRHELGGPAGWGGFERVDDPQSDQWTYHAVADVILAHSLIRSFSEVAPERTGITGISWGGYLTCITASVDSRFKFAVPVYGCGFLGENSAWLDTFHGMGSEKASRWLAAWDPSVYLPRASMPFLWVTGTNDFAYPMDSLQKSYRLTKGLHTLCVRIRMPHGHGGAGENPEEIHAFADSVLEGSTPLATITKEWRDGRKVWANYTAKAPIVKAELVYTKALGKWQDRLWESAPAELDAAHGAVHAEAPLGATVCYLNLIDERNLVVSSEHIELSSN